MRTARLGVAAVLTAAFAGAASAADLPVKAPPLMAPLPIAYNWTGFYVGADIGYGWGSTDHTFSNGSPAGNSDPNGVLGGGFVGYNYQVASWVFGLEGDIEGSGMSGSFSNVTMGSSTATAKLTLDASVRGRIGFAWDRALLYVTGGGALAHYDFRGGPAVATAKTPLCPQCGFSQDLTGWTVGAGMEYAFAPNLSARVEYRYTDYGSATGTLAPVYANVLMRAQNTTNVVRLGLSYMFDANDSPLFMMRY